MVTIVLGMLLIKIGSSIVERRVLKPFDEQYKVFFRLSPSVHAFGLAVEPIQDLRATSIGITSSPTAIQK